MAVQYILISVQCETHLADLLIAEMSGIGYDSFVIRETGFQASVISSDFDKSELDLLIRQYTDMGQIEYLTEELEEQNWNAIWEKNFEPVIIDNRCIIRASFHQPENPFPLEIIINPKMSFGTGHHETTRLMIETQLETNHHNKSILDVGCGSGILSILAEKLGARKVTGIDIDPWAFENASENIVINACHNIQVIKTDINNLDDIHKYDILLANINRHIILQDMKYYGKLIASQGLLICSGFLTEDSSLIISEADLCGFILISEKAMNKWSALVFHKKTN
jgi:ribosomal protein L11 methyltransferase